MNETAILCIGTELLDGRIRDRNAPYIGELSATRPLEVAEIRTLPDDTERIARALRECADRDLVVVSGGLGPTDDDVTRRAAAAFFDVPLVEDDASLTRLEERFERRNLDFTENNRRQCQFPEGAEILISEVGTADGFHLRRGDTDFVFFPGVPPEFRWFADHHLPVAEETESGAYQKKLAFFGRAESDLETMLGPLPDRARRADVEIRFRATFPIIELTVRGPRTEADEIEQRLRDRIGPWLVAEDDETPAGRLGERLVEADATVSVAESCTAGLVAARLTSVSGSSRYFEEGYLTYADRAKRRLVDVDEAMLEAHGAVSPQVCTQMAAGARRRSGADFALAVSGIAGPTGGTEDKPVGTVDIALAGSEGVRFRRSFFSGRNRREVRVLSVFTALSGLLWHLEGRLERHAWNGPASYGDVQRGLETGD